MPNDDYIKRIDALKAILGVSIYDTIEELDGARTIAENTWADGLYDAYKIIEEEVDAADVEPKRKTGRWVYKHRTRVRYHKETGEDVITGEKRTVMVYTDLSGKYPHCPYCDALAADSFMDYCPHCGAKMQGEEDGT